MPFQSHNLKPFTESFQRHLFNIFLHCTLGQDEGPDQGSMPDVVIFAESTEHVSEVILYQPDILEKFDTDISYIIKPLFSKKMVG